MVTRRAVAIAVSLTCCATATAQQTQQQLDTATAVCYGVQTSTNTLVTYTETMCIPSPGKEGASSFLVISSEPVFSAEASKKAWLLVVVAVIGKEMNDRPTFRGDEVWVSDVNQTKARVAYVLPTSLTKSLQSRAYNGQIDLDQMYAEITRNLVRKTVSR